MLGSGGLNTGLVGKKKRVEFLLHVLKIVENNAELRDSQVGSLVIDHISEQST